MRAQRLWDGTKNLGDYKIMPNITLEVHHCGVCGVIFALDVNFADARRSDKQSWCCPNGHSFSWKGRPEVEELRDQVAAAQRRVRATQDLLHHEERSHAATRGHLTRTKKRVAHGVCPCCNRTFAQLERHMASQHPEYVASANE